MVGSIYKDANGKEFLVEFVDHNMNGSWVHYKQVDTDNKFNCLVDSFKERFTRVEKLR